MEEYIDRDAGVTGILLVDDSPTGNITGSQCRVQLPLRFDGPHIDQGSH